MSSTLRPLLITDFDGTLTQRDFYDVMLETVYSDEIPDVWDDVRHGRKTLFETLRDIFALKPIGEATLITLARRTGLEDSLADSIDQLHAAGWEIQVVSAGCLWYIRRLFDDAGIYLPIHANPGHVDHEGYLRMTAPVDSPYYEQSVGVSKAAIVQAMLATGRTVAYVGDGPPDLPAAQLISEDLRFAKGDLAARLTEQGERFIPFSKWSEVAATLSTRQLS